MAKTFSQLTPDQQKKAIDKCLTQLLTDILENGMRFNDQLNHDDLQARIDAAIAQAERLHTPWFAAECILETCREDLEAMARPEAEDAIYPESHERCIQGVAA